MNTGDWINAVGVIALPIVLAVWGIWQWRLDRRLQAQSQAEERARVAARELEESEREARRRDDHLTNWGMSVIALMAELQGHCEPGAKPTSAVSDITWRASALVDQGRLFFPNVDAALGGTGLRPIILDEVVRATYVARTLLTRDDPDLIWLRDHIYAARRRFVKILQSKVRETLYDVDDHDVGVSIPRDPEDWSAQLIEGFKAR